MPNNETVVNQGLRLIVDNAMPSECQDSLLSDCQGTATETRHTAKAEAILPPYTGKKIQDSLGISERTFYRYLAEIKDAWFWLSEATFREGKGYSSLTLEQMERRNSLSSKDEYVALIHGENAKVIALYQQTEPQPIEQTVTVDPPVSAITRIQQDRYMVPNFGSDRLAKAQERSNNQRSSLTNTQERVRQALLGLATQTAEDTIAGSLDKQSEREAIYEEAYADGLEELQIRHAAKRDAAADWESFKAQAMGKQPGNAPAAVS